MRVAMQRSRQPGLGIEALDPIRKYPYNIALDR